MAMSPEIGSDGLLLECPLCAITGLATTGDRRPALNAEAGRGVAK
jgi:hypothetical protein